MNETQPSPSRPMTLVRKLFRRGLGVISVAITIQDSGEPLLSIVYLPDGSRCPINASRHRFNLTELHELHTVIGAALVEMAALTKKED